LRPIDPKALKRKKRPPADGKKTGVSARHPTKAVVLEPVLAKDQSRTVGKGERHSAPPRSPEARLEEALGLARAIDLEVRASGDALRLRQGNRA
jgi:GTP-binding protein HflX